MISFIACSSEICKCVSKFSLVLPEIKVKMVYRLLNASLFLSITYFHVQLSESCGVYEDGSIFCYDDTDPTCPSPSEWKGFCDDGVQQSPIRLPNVPLDTTTSFMPKNSMELNMKEYQAESFKIQNNGHTVVLKLNHDAEDCLARPTALKRWEGTNITEYYLDSIHFHWGLNNLHGSEHCFEHRCYSMEMHLVHLRPDCESVAEAVELPDKDTIAVVGVMLDVIEETDILGNPDLAPIVQNIKQVVNATNSETYLDVYQSLDFTKILTLVTGKGSVFHYKGSLTTPDCEEKVNWYVFNRPIGISKGDISEFRTIRDFRGELLEQNHRPVMERTGRNVFIAEVRPF